MSDITSEDVFEVEKIISCQLDKDGLHRVFRVRWKGCNSDEDTWEPLENLLSCNLLLKQYKKERRKRNHLKKQLNVSTDLGTMIKIKEEPKDEVINVRNEDEPKFQHNAKSQPASKLEESKAVLTKSSLSKPVNDDLSRNTDLAVNHQCKITFTNKIFKCTYCEYKTADKNHLRQHKKIHTGEKLFKCIYCNYKTGIKSDLTRHIRIHTGEKPFKCTFCDYKGTQKQSLTIHLASHTGEKPFKCTYCKYKTVRKSHLTRHLLIHTGEKPFKCTNFDYTCNRKQSLTVHLTSHTG